MKKFLTILRLILSIVGMWLTGCSSIVGAIEWPEVQIHRGSLDVKIVPQLVDHNRAPATPAN